MDVLWIVLVQRGSQSALKILKKKKVPPQNPFREVLDQSVNDERVLN